MYSMRPEVGKYCWDKTIFKGKEELEEPEEMVNSQVEVEEESLLKIRDGIDQMNVEDDVEGNEEVEYFDLVPVPEPELEIVSEPRTKIAKVQSKITTFFTGKKQ